MSFRSVVFKVFFCLTLGLYFRNLILKSFVFFIKLMTTSIISAQTYYSLMNDKKNAQIILSSNQVQEKTFQLWSRTLRIPFDV